MVSTSSTRCHVKLRNLWWPLRGETNLEFEMPKYPNHAFGPHSCEIVVGLHEKPSKGEQQRDCFFLFERSVPLCNSQGNPTEIIFYPAEYSGMEITFADKVFRHNEFSQTGLRGIGWNGLVSDVLEPDRNRNRRFKLKNGPPGDLAV